MQYLMESLKVFVVTQRVRLWRQSHLFFTTQQPSLGQASNWGFPNHIRLHTTVGWTPLDEGSVCPRNLNLTTRTHKIYFSPLINFIYFRANHGFAKSQVAELRMSVCFLTRI